MNEHEDSIRATGFESGLLGTPDQQAKKITPEQSWHRTNSKKV